MQQIGLAGTGCGSAHINSGDSSLVEQHHRAAGGPAIAGEMADAQTRDIGKCAVMLKRMLRSKRQSAR